MKKITFRDIRNSTEFNDLILASNEYLQARGYTEHGIRHVGYVSKTTANILRELGYDKRTVELGEIAGWIHDIGNAVSRTHHGITGASLALPMLIKMGMPYTEAAIIAAAVGNHEEETGFSSNAVSAALVLADKSDAHRTRVRRDDYDPNDIHDRVNYSIKKNYIVIDKENMKVKLFIFMDQTCSIMEFFQIYLGRMQFSEKAAAVLNCRFELIINNVLINNHSLPTTSDKLKLSKTETNVSEDIKDNYIENVMSNSEKSD